MTGRYVEVNMDETNEIMRMSCPVCKYPMRVLGKHEDNIYHCYCAACQTDRYMKDTLDTEKLTFKEFDRGMKRGKGIDLEQISDLVYELYDEKEQLKSENQRLKRLNTSYISIDINKVLPAIAECKGITVEEYLEEIEEEYTKGKQLNIPVDEIKDIVVDGRCRVTGIYYD